MGKGDEQAGPTHCVSARYTLCKCQRVSLRVTNSPHRSRKTSAELVILKGFWKPRADDAGEEGPLRVCSKPLGVRGPTGTRRGRTQLRKPHLCSSLPHLPAGAKGTRRGSCRGPANPEAPRPCSWDGGGACACPARGDTAPRRRPPPASREGSVSRCPGHVA